jgi:hypothetical protein
LSNRGGTGKPAASRNRRLGVALLFQRELPIAAIDTIFAAKNGLQQENSERRQWTDQSKEALIFLPSRFQS